MSYSLVSVSYIITTNAFHDKLQFSYAHIFFDLLKTVVKIKQSLRVDNINFILCRQKWDLWSSGLILKLMNTSDMILSSDIYTDHRKSMVY